MRNLVVLVALVLIATALASPAGAAMLDTSLRFSTIETPHFSVHFHQGLADVARKAARIAEEVHVPLVREFHWEPREKTQLVLIDDTDFANGLATVLPYNTIFIQVVPPSLASTIGEYDDWLRVLIVHEYTHVLTMDPNRGYSRVMRNIFGKPLPAGDPFTLLMFLASAPPNVFLPRWWHEGMATWSETAHSGKGRGRSSYYEMILRSAVAENNLPSIDQINGDVPYWPDGHLPYIFGLRLSRFIADKYGREALGSLNLAHSGRFPYAINAPASDLANDKDYPAIYRDMLEDLKLEQTARIASLKQVPLTPLRVIASAGENLTNPRFSPDGKFIAFTRRDPNDHAVIIVTDKEGKAVHRRIRRLPSDQAISWAPDGTSLYFSQAEINRGFNVFQDLYAYDIERDKMRRLTHGKRIGEPEISPDGSTFAMVVSGRGSQNLALLPARKLLAREEEPEPRSVTDYRQFRVATPRWSSDSRRIAYTVTDNAGRTGIHIYDVVNGVDLPLVTSSNNLAYPCWSKNGKYLIYVSDETGVYNLFAYSLAEGRSFQVTHLLGGAMQPDMAPDGSTIIFSSYTSRGFQIAAVDVDILAWSARRSPVVAPSWQMTDRPAKLRQDGNGSGESLPQTAFKPYSPWQTLAPRFWLPTVSSDDNRNVVVGAFSAGQDVLGYNTWLAAASLGERHRKVYYDLAYRNDYLYPSLTVETYALPVFYSDLLRRGDYIELNRGLILEAAIPLNYLESSYRLLLGYQIQDQQALSRLQGGLFNGLPVFQGRRDNLFAGVEFGNSLKYPASVSHEEGRTVSLRYTYYSRDLGSDLNSREYSAAYAEYLRLPGSALSHHVLFLSLAGAVAEGDRTVQQAFQLGGLGSILNRFPLRGYPARFETGKYVATGTLEYRAPVRELLRGFGTKPFFFERLHGAIFTDAGQVWDDQRSFKLDHVKVGAGLEARLDMTFGYWLKITPAIGYAHGFNQGGEDRAYFTIYVNL